MEKVSRHNVVVANPSKGSRDSMPLGNGDIGVNAWVEKTGDIVFYLSKTDAWNENMRLLKLGKIRVKLTPNPFEKTKQFHQELKLNEGMLLIKSGVDSCIIKLWIDANNPVVHLEISGSEQVKALVKLEMWRDKERILDGQELHSSYVMLDSPDTVIEHPDTVLETENCIAWCHQNKASVWKQTLDLQGLSEFIEQSTDPLQNRTFGVMIKGNSLINKSVYELESETPKNSHHIYFVAHTSQVENTNEWLKQIKQKVSEIEDLEIETARLNHQKWWSEFWERSYIYLSGNEEAEPVTRGYVLQRYLNACAGRGAFPIKFNGSIFTMETFEDIANTTYDADYRRWGGPYWFQNTRLTYWPMLMSGDYDLMKPFFKMYMDALSLAEVRTQKYYGHSGAFFPETMCFWGTYSNNDYGWNREGKPLGLSDNPYIKYYWQSGLELCSMMLEYYHFTQDNVFKDETLIPFTNSVIDFYEHHYEKNSNGEIVFKPAASLETWHNVINPLPEIVGLRYVIEKMTGQCSDCISQAKKADFANILASLPPVPKGVEGGKEFLLATETKLDENMANSENPELYAVFPYRVHGVGKPDIEVGIETFNRRLVKDSRGWRQDSIQAAFLGLTQIARDYVVYNFSTKSDEYAFPGFYGPNFDWVPDQDHGCVASLALQAMLVQCVGDKILLFPAFPEEWDVEFKLNAPYNTTVELKRENGRIVYLNVQPESRRKDIIFIGNNECSLLEE